MVLLWSTKVFLPSSKHCYIKRIVPGTQKYTCIEVWNSISLCLLFGLIITTSVQHFDVNLASTWRLSSTNVRTLVTSFDQRHCFVCNAIWKSIFACAFNNRRYTRAEFYKRTCIKVVNRSIQSLGIIWNLYHSFPNLFSLN